MRHLRPALSVSQANVVDNRAARAHLCLDISWWDPAATSLVISAHLGEFQKPAPLKVTSPFFFSCNPVPDNQENNFPDLYLPCKIMAVSTLYSEATDIGSLWFLSLFLFYSCLFSPCFISLIWSVVLSIFPTAQQSVKYQIVY